MSQILMFLKGIPEAYIKQNIHFGIYFQRYTNFLTYIQELFHQKVLLTSEFKKSEAQDMENYFAVFDYFYPFLGMEQN